MSMKKFSTRALTTLSLSIALATGAVMPMTSVAQPRHDEIQLAADAPGPPRGGEGRYAVGHCRTFSEGTLALAGDLAT